MNFAYETYKKVEAPENFADRSELEKYRELLLARARKKEIPFFKKEFPHGLGDTLEVGSGNSRILFALEKEGMIKSGCGLEISPSRSAFAEEWKKDLGSKVENICGDILKDKIAGKFDTILCLTSIFPFFDELQKNGLDKFLRIAEGILCPGGTLVIESVTFRQEIEAALSFGGKARLWAEWSKNDPFQFNLVEYSWDKNTRRLKAVTYNTKRHELFIDGPTVKKWHMEDKKSIMKKLSRAGFRVLEVFGGYDRSPFKDNSLEYIFIAKKKK